MREIKFRAWDKQNKIMLDNSLNGMNHDSWLLLLQLNTGNVWKKGFFNDDLTERMIVMQYTGLLDKSGKEIYEGDIVTSCHYNYYTKERILDRKDSEEHNMQKGIVEWVQYNCSFMIMKRMDSNFCDQWNNSIELKPVENNSYEIEIIGNIYENPKLLKRHC